ncbi:unnamed protein product, partial [Mesorhabditis spiculigera]
MPAGIDVNMIGWGNIYVVPKEQRVQPMQLRGFIGQMVPEEECRKLNTMTHAACFDGGKKHSGVCNGDSGSPISTYAPAINKQSYYVQVSLVSTGNGPKDGTGNCGKDETTWTFGPEIAMYCDWIDNVTGKNSIQFPDLSSGPPVVIRISEGEKKSVDDYPYIVSVGSLAGKGAVAGTDHVRGHVDAGTQVLKIEKMHVHPANNYDILLIKLATPIIYGKRVQPVALRKEPNVSNDTDIYMLGWGATAAGRPEQLMGFTMRLLAGKGCRYRHGNCYVAVNKTSSTCSGDSGSPIAYYDTGLRKYVQLSPLRGRYGGPCGSRNTTMVGADISQHCDWIADTTGKKLCI